MSAGEPQQVMLHKSVELKQGKDWQAGQLAVTREALVFSGQTKLSFSLYEVTGV